jgi:hypothetical protein
MSQAVRSPSANAGSPRRCWSELLAGVVLAALLIFNVPLFLCMPLWQDVTLYDICARNVLNGGTPYRDVFDNNLPGIVWLHVAIRSLLGWRSEAIRLADLLFLSGSLVLLAHWLKLVGRSGAVVGWTLVVMFTFYFSTSEFCHCQRDPWALLPMLAGLYLRSRQLSRLTAPAASLSRLAAWALAEGLCWGAAVWIKPQFFVAAFICWLVSALQAMRQAPMACRRLLADASGLLGGGLIAGSLGFGWLEGTGAWPYFVDIMLHWNWEYLPHVAPEAYVGLFLTKLFPWGLVHFLAVPLALVTIFWGLTPLRGMDADKLAILRFRALLAALYVGWLLQVILLQHGFDYQLVPPVLLALALLAGAGPSGGHVRWAVLAGFLGTAAVLHPMFHARRATAWPRCLREGSTPQVRDRLALTGAVTWTDLKRAEDYLESLHLQQGELTCYDWRTNALYSDLGLRPSTRFINIDSLLGFYTGHRATIRRALIDSRQRYVVTDLAMKGIREQDLKVGPDGPLDLPAGFPSGLRDLFPYYEPIVFRSNRYAVHRVTRPVEVLVPGDSEGDRPGQD